MNAGTCWPMLLACAGFAMPAAAVVLDFDAVPIANEQRTGSFEEDGFRVALEGDHFHVYGPTCDKPGSTGPNNCIGMDDYGGFGPSRLRVTRFDGGPFDLVSFNLLDATQGYGPFTDCLTGWLLLTSLASAASWTRSRARHNAASILPGV